MLLPLLTTNTPFGTQTQAICDATGTQTSSSYHPLYQAGFLLVPAHFGAEDVTAAAASTMSPMAASAGAISASMIRSALCHRSSSFSTSSFSMAGLAAPAHSPAAAPLDLLLVVQGTDGAGGNSASGSHATGSPTKSRASGMPATPRQQEGVIRGVLAFSEDVLDPHMMELLAEHFQVELNISCWCCCCSHSIQGLKVWLTAVCLLSSTPIKLMSCRLPLLHPEPSLLVPRCVNLTPAGVPCRSCCLPSRPAGLPGNDVTY